MSLSAQDVSVEIRGKVLLSHVSVDVAPGCVLGILGPNGAGKSTLLRCLSGARAPSSGRIALDEVPLLSRGPRWLALRRAVVAQKVDLRFRFTVREIAAMGRAPHRSSDAVADRLACEALERVEVAHLAGRRWPTLSGGEQQRVQLARALVQLAPPGPPGPRYLLLDEPTASLDLRQQHRTLALARHLAHEENVGVVVVLHDLNLASAYTDRLLLLRGGRTVAAGDTASVLDAYRIQQTFGLPVQILDHPAGGRLIAAMPPTPERRR